jgi:hypothetical protein
MACNADLIPAVLGTESQVLDLGRALRLAPPRLRRGIALRDGGCAFPGCTTPMRHCDLHHVRPWQEGGRTDRDNIVAPCRAHHAVCEPRPPTVDADGRSVVPDGWDVRIDRRGLPEFLPPEGSRCCPDAGPSRRAWGNALRPRAAAGSRRLSRGGRAEHGARSPRIPDLTAIAGAGRGVRRAARCARGTEGGTGGPSGRR